MSELILLLEIVCFLLMLSVVIMTHRERKAALLAQERLTLITHLAAAFPPHG